METTLPNYFHFVSASGANRYFKVDWINNKCTQVVLSAGDTKKGRPHMLGVTRLAMQSFRGNYFWHYGRKAYESGTKCLATTQTQYEKAFNQVIKQL